MMRYRAALPAVLLMALTAGGVLADDKNPSKADPNTAHATKANGLTVGFFLRAKVFNQSTVVKNFNAQVDSWQKQLDAANKAGDRATAKAIHEKYDQASASLKPTFAKVLEKVLPKVCKDKGVAVAFNGQGQVAWKKADVETVDLTEPLLQAIAREVPTRKPEPAAVITPAEEDEKGEDEESDEDDDAAAQSDGWGRPVDTN